MIWLAAALTIAIETLLLYALGYRTRRFVLVCALINLATNLALNLGLSYLTPPTYWVVLVPAELVVVAVEWAVLRLVADHGRTVAWPSPANWRLLGYVALANLASFAIGTPLIWLLARY